MSLWSTPPSGIHCPDRLYPYLLAPGPYLASMRWSPSFSSRSYLTDSAFQSTVVLKVSPGGGRLATADAIYSLSAPFLFIFSLSLHQILVG